MGYVNPPIERPIGTLNFDSGKFSELQSPSQLPNEIYQELLLRFAGTHTKGNGDGADVPLNPLTLMPNVRVAVTGTDFVDLPAVDIYQLNKIQKPDRNGRGAENFVASQAAAVGATPFSVDLPLPFELPDMIEPRRGFFRSGRYPSSKLRVDWGTAAVDMAPNETGTNTVTACTLEVIAKVWTGEPAFENPPPRPDGQPNFMLHKRTNQIFPTNGNQLSKYPLEIPRDPSLLRGILMRTYTPGPERPVRLFEDADVIQLKYNKNDMKIDTTWGRLRSENARQIGSALDDGYVWIDLAPDGDWNRLRDTTQGVYELYVSTTNAVASSLIRLSYVRYAPGL